jgi:membrane-associated protein
LGLEFEKDRDNAGMDTLFAFLDLLLHIDVVLKNWLTLHGELSYLFVFMIIFIETGLVFFPLLPGDSLLFMIGTFCGLGLMSTEISLAVCLSAAILGDQLNYWIGQHLGQKIIHSPSPWISKGKLSQTQLFFQRFGSLTLVIARFIPFARTFAPFCAGLSLMNALHFSIFNLMGAVLWVTLVGMLGYFLGEVQWVKAHVQVVVWALILIPSALAIVSALKATESDRSEATPL